MSRTKFGVAVSEDVVTDLEEVVEECTDLQASRSEVVEAILTAYFASEADHTERVRELVIRRRNNAL